MTARQLALKVLFEVDKNNAYTGIELKNQLKDSDLSAADKSFATELVYGVIKNKTRLDYIISKYSSQKLNKLSVWILNILRMGVYQMLFLDKVPHSAAVNEGVKLAKRYGHSASAGFVNAVLRNISRSGDVTYPDGTDYYRVYYSHPSWLLDMLFDQYGEDAKLIVENNNKVAPVTVRVNTLKTTPDEVVKRLKDQQIGVEKTDEPNVLKLTGYGDMARLLEYKDGLVTPQGLSSYIAACEVEPKEGELVLDLCAAPGGKSTALAELSGDRANIQSFDLYEHKVDLISKNCERLGIKSVIPKVADALTFNEELEGKADKVLADVPCSGLGIIRKKPDIKWNRTKDELKSIVEIQRQIFKNASRYLKTGGTLVYSTCTINKDENERVAEDFAKEYGLRVIKSQTFLPRDEYDGFYICKMIKEK